MTLQRIKRIKSHAGHARFLADLDGAPAGWIPRQPDIPSPYAYSSEWIVFQHGKVPVIIVETAHRQYDVFAVPEQMIRTNEPLEMTP